MDQILQRSLNPIALPYVRAKLGLGNPFFSALVESVEEGDAFAFLPSRMTIDRADQLDQDPPNESDIAMLDAEQLAYESFFKRCLSGDSSTIFFARTPWLQDAPCLQRLPFSHAFIPNASGLDSVLMLARLDADDADSIRKALSSIGWGFGGLANCSIEPSDWHRKRLPASLLDELERTTRLLMFDLFRGQGLLFWLPR